MDGETQPLVVTPALIRYTREIEVDLPGAPVPDEAWPIFFGAQSGSIAWPHYERMARSREAALVLISMHGAGRAEDRRSLVSA
jgi:hypothetical protein